MFNKKIENLKKKNNNNNNKTKNNKMGRKHPFWRFLTIQLLAKNRTL